MSTLEMILVLALRQFSGFWRTNTALSHTVKLAPRSMRPPGMAEVSILQEQKSTDRGVRPPWMAEVQKMQEQFSALHPCKQKSLPVGGF